MARLAIHPGEQLAEELKALDMSAAELARKVEVPTNRITGIVNGQRAITGDTALRLGHFFGTSPVFWLNLQFLYELRWPSRERARRSGPCPSSGAAGAGVSAGRRTHDSAARMTGDHPATESDRHPSDRAHAASQSRFSAWASRRSSTCA